jgi:hypothetical protein
MKTFAAKPINVRLPIYGWLDSDITIPKTLPIEIRRHEEPVGYESIIGIYNNSNHTDEKFLKKFITKNIDKKRKALNPFIRDIDFELDITQWDEEDGEAVMLGVLVEREKFDNADFEGSRGEFLAVVINEILKAIKKAAEDAGILADEDENLLETAGA